MVVGSISKGAHTLQRLQRLTSVLRANNGLDKNSSIVVPAARATFRAGHVTRCERAVQVNDVVTTGRSIRPPGGQRFDAVIMVIANHAGRVAIIVIRH